MANTKTKEPIYLKGFTTKKVLLFFGAFLLGITASFLAKLFIPYISVNPIGMFIIFPAVSIPLCVLVLRYTPKCKICGGKTKPAATPSGSKFDFLDCSKCGQKHTIDSTTRS